MAVGEIVADSVGAALDVLQPPAACIRDGGEDLFSVLIDRQGGGEAVSVGRFWGHVVAPTGMGPVGSTHRMPWAEPGHR
ncbi:hypothetical protein SAMN02745225_00451 [Ferrithrix thermotolerans DSM 19514]|uniref:Uncharacterized protein n=1 Tax=Ferrithrix thermotolerans DSM 19514 TaxID=1121881 RepID=A0A1M4SZ64_9ACTN|nr:hypothetical protein [Ferrithrix thermotolerans]SHE37327.1 hypothetical protein SAMN02745225_00451 [Ferrithrix thermotolerans DSM 19514]